MLSFILAGVVLASPVAVPIPGGEGGIGFDDLVFSAHLRRFIVPGGRTGSVFLIDPETRRLEPLGALSKFPTWKGGHGQSATSADAGRDTLFVADRTARRLLAIPLGGKGTPAEAQLASGPDYVRWVEPTGEVWVTEPDAEAIEIFRFDPRGQPALVQAGRIAVADGPESLVIDPEHGRAFTNTWHDRTLAIGLRERSVAASWSNGCKDARGLDADRTRGLLFVGCAEGLATVIDTPGRAGWRVRREPAPVLASRLRGVDPQAYVRRRAGGRLPTSARGPATDRSLALAGAAVPRPTAWPPAGEGSVLVCDPPEAPACSSARPGRSRWRASGRGSSSSPRSRSSPARGPTVRSDQTDADVAQLHVIELELGPLQFERSGGRTGYVPTFIFNFGAIPGWELVVEADGSGTVAGPREPGEVFQLETSVSFKGVVRRGSLQDGSRVSVAVEPAVLLPATAGASGFGFAAGVIVSQRWPALALHLNLVPAWSRAQQSLRPGRFHRRGPGRLDGPPGGRGVRRGRARGPWRDHLLPGRSRFWPPHPGSRGMLRCRWARFRAPVWSSCEWA